MAKMIVIEGQVPVSGKELRKSDVVQRLEDWQDRLKKLFDQIDQWRVQTLPNVESSRDRTFQIEEELMRKFGIKPGTVPTYTITQGSKRLSFVPSGLWIIGANGRVNVVGGKKEFMLVDMAEPGSCKSKWMLVSHDHRKVLEEFDRNKLRVLFEKAA